MRPTNWNILTKKLLPSANEPGPMSDSGMCMRELYIGMNREGSEEHFGTTSHDESRIGYNCASGERIAATPKSACRTTRWRIPFRAGICCYAAQRDGGYTW